MNDIGAAIRLCLYLMGFILLIILLEKGLRGQKRFGLTNAKARPLTPHKLNGMPAWSAALYCFAVLGFGFLFPVLQLLVWGAASYSEVVRADFAEAAFNTVQAAVICSVVIVACAVIITNSSRLSLSLLVKNTARLTSVGYSLPGAVLAVGVLILFTTVTRITEAFCQYSAITSLYMLYFAYIVRFLAVGCHSVEHGFEKVGKSFFEAAKTLGCSTTKAFWKVDAPMIRPSLIGAFILVFVDMVKELPLTLILRPFNYNSLASKVYEYAHDERIRDSAPAALIIVAVCAVSVYYLSQSERE